MLYHLTQQAQYTAADRQRGADYRPISLQHEGYVHCSPDLGTLLDVANAFYASESGRFVALQIDESKLASAVKWEAPATFIAGRPHSGARVRGSAFPHVYGPINGSAVVDVLTAVRENDDRGAFTAFLLDALQAPQ